MQTHKSKIGTRIVNLKGFFIVHLKEAEEDGVNGHRVDGEETGSNGIAADRYEEKGCKLVVQLPGKDIRRVLK